MPPSARSRHQISVVWWLVNMDQDLLRGTLFIVLDIQSAWPFLVAINDSEHEDGTMEASSTTAWDGLDKVARNHLDTSKGERHWAGTLLRFEHTEAAAPEDDGIGHIRQPSSTFLFPHIQVQSFVCLAQEALSALAGSAEMYPPRACPCSPRFAGVGGEVRHGRPPGRSFVC